jgi:hypothetical protein
MTGVVCVGIARFTLRAEACYITKFTIGLRVVRSSSHLMKGSARG